MQIPLNTLKILARFRPDVVVSDELGVRTMWSALFSRIQRRPLIVWWEGVPHSDGTGRFRTLRRTRLLRSSSRVWGNGLESARSLARYGVPVVHVDLGMTGMDTDPWRIAVDKQRSSIRPQVRAEHGLEGAVLLFVGRLIRLKGVLEILEAITILADIKDLPPWSMLWVGAGPLGKEVDQWAATHPGIPLARTGFIQPTELPQYYAAADIFVMPSLDDVWGLVCLEALVAGLPQVTSSFAGAASDLITSNEIGDITDPRDAPAFAQHLANRIREAPTVVSDSARIMASVRWSPSEGAKRGLTSIRTCLAANSSTLKSATGRQSAEVRTEPEAVVTISVDDGHPSDRRAADLLHDLGYEATFYVPARNAERQVMGVQDVRSIAQRFEVGAHTFSHVPLTQLDRGGAYREIVDGKTWLEDVTSASTTSFCYPLGKFTNELATGGGSWVLGARYNYGKYPRSIRKPLYIGDFDTSVFPQSYGPTSPRRLGA